MNKWLQQLPYEESPPISGTFQLGGRVKSGMINVCKIMLGVNKMEDTLIWGYPVKPIGRGFRTDKMKSSFTQHIVEAWNLLPREVMATNVCQKGGWTSSWGIQNYLTTSQDGCMLPPLLEVACFLIPAAVCELSRGSWLPTVGIGSWARWSDPEGSYSQVCYALGQVFLGLSISRLLDVW